MTISLKYVLADPSCLPTASVERSAAFDLKANLEPIDLLLETPLSRDEEIDCTNAAISKNLFVNGKLAEDFLEADAVSELSRGRKLLYLPPLGRKIVNAGFKVGLSTDDPNKLAVMLICSRSGLSCRHGISVINAPGVVDEDYPDWVGVGLINLGTGHHLFSHGARIAQAMFVEVENPSYEVVEDLALSGERLGGFGHTGV
jgi:dUTP pyrophosphatase